MKESKIELIDVYLLAFLLMVAGYAISQSNHVIKTDPNTIQSDNAFNKWRRIF